VTTDPPDYVTVDLDGFTAAGGARPSEPIGCAMVVGVAVALVPATAMAIARPHTDPIVRALLVCAQILVVVVGAGWSWRATEAYELRLSQRGLQLTRSRWGRRRRVTIPLDDLAVDTDVSVDRRGPLVSASLILTTSAGQHVLVLPTHRRRPDDVRREATWLEQALRRVVRAARAAAANDDDDGAQLRRALHALRATAGAPAVGQR